MQDNRGGSHEFDFSICVPTFNRADLLPRLFANLGAQTGATFEVLVVNDGSSDGTEIVLAELAAAAPFPTVHLKQPNRGKGAALNKALDVARGRFFFIMDDDDLIADRALQDILATWESIAPGEMSGFCGVCGLCGDAAGKVVGQRFPDDPIDDDFFSMRIIRGVRGDKREVVLREAIGDFRFPIYEGEKRTPASILWFHLAARFRMRFVNRVWLIKEYRADGMSANALKQKVRSPNSMAGYYRSAIELFPRMPGSTRYRFLVSYLRFSLHAGVPLPSAVGRVPHRAAAWLAAPVAWLIAAADRRQLSRTA